MAAPRFVGIGALGLTEDEKYMQEIAAGANAVGRPADHGLRSSRGVFYGPFSIWAHQILLRVTSSPKVMRFWAVLLQTLAFAVGLYGIARLCPFLHPALALLPLLSPYFAFFSLLIWDFHAPLAILALFAYLTFLRTDRWLPLFGTGLLLTLGLLDHLKGLSTVAAVGTHAIVFRRESLRRHAAWIAASITAYGLLAFPYLRHMAVHYQPVRTQFGGLASLGFSFTGPILFSVVDISRYFGVGWQGAGLVGTLFLGASLATAIVYLFYYGGLLDQIREVRTRRRGEEAELSALCLLALGYLTALNLLMGLVSYPHYFCAAWPYLFVTIWQFLTKHGGRREVRWALAVYGAAMLVCDARLTWVLGTV